MAPAGGIAGLLGGLGKLLTLEEGEEGGTPVVGDPILWDNDNQPVFFNPILWDDGTQILWDV